MKKINPRKIVFFSVLLCLSLFMLVSTLPSQEVGVLKAKKTNKEATKKARADYFQRMLRDPKTKTIPADIRRLELKHAATMPKRVDGVSKSGAMPQFSWNEAGPNDVGGRTRALAVDLNNSNTILAGGTSGGIWKSTDAGASWALKTNPDNPAGITYITQDPRSGNRNNWYATTGEYVGGSGTDRGGRAFYYGNGILHSSDSGESWQLIEPNNNDLTVFDAAFDYQSKVLVNPNSGTIFIASNGFSLLRAPGNIANATKVLGKKIFPFWTDFDIAPDGTIIAVTSEGFLEDPTEVPGVFRSTDDGVTWQGITPASYPATPDRSVIAMAPSNPNIAYMLTFTGNISSSNNEAGEKEEMQLYKFDISAGTSQNLSGNLPDFAGKIGDINSQDGYNFVIEVKPDDENHVFIGGTNLYVSRDGFATRPTDIITGWVGGYSTANDITQYTNHHPDQHALFFDPQNPKALWSGHDGGLSYIPDVTASGAFSWQNKNNGYNVTQYFHVALPASPDDDRLLGGTQDNGSPFFSFDPTTMSTSGSEDVSSGDGAYAFLGETYAIASSQNGKLFVYSYTNAGDLQFLNQITPAGASGQLFINPFVTDPIEETIIYYLAGKSLWRRNAGSVSNTMWAQLASLQLTGQYGYSALATSGGSGTTVLYLGSSGSGLVPQVHRFDDAGTSTSAATNVSIPGAVADAYIHSIAVNPNNSNEVLVAMSNYNIVGLYHSSNAGTSWTAIEGNLEGTEFQAGTSNVPGPSIRSVAILPLGADTGYLVGTSTGFYSTILLNGNNTIWQQEASSELGNVIVESIATRTSDGRVALATHGRGLFIGMPLNPVANEEEMSDQPELFRLEQNYPNPFNPATSISFTLAQPSQVTVTVYDIAGRAVKTLLSGAPKEPGTHQIAFDAGNLSSGSYLYELEAVSLSSSETIHKESKVMTLAK